MWLLLLLGPLILYQRALHREIQAVFLLITRRPDITVALFSLIFLPGVALHEGSHYLMAKILGVPTGKISLIPESLEKNRLRLGFVETSKTDILRDALIGMAPLLAGGLFVAYAGIVRLDMLSVWEGIAQRNFESVVQGFESSLAAPDFWLWFYLTLTVSSTMFPSPSDRRAWLPVTLIVILVVGLGLIFGAGPWMSENILPVLNDALRSAALIFAISIGVHLIVLLPAWLLRQILSKATGMKISS
jgi:hypothetical protein